MKDKSEEPSEGLGLLANGSSRRWDVAVDEALDREEWSLEIDGPQTYLVFQIRDLEIIPEALRFLQSGLQSDQSPRRRQKDDEGALPLGRFGSASVSLVWDNEDFQRCFIVIGPGARSTARLSLGADDVRMLIEALRQVTKDLSQFGVE